MAARRVRIAVAITPSGSWGATGWGYAEGNTADRNMLDSLDMQGMADEPGTRVVWVEADVPVPGDEIEGEVSDG